MGGNTGVCSATGVVRYDDRLLSAGGGSAGVLEGGEAVLVVMVKVVLVITGGLVTSGPRRGPGT